MNGEAVAGLAWEAAVPRLKARPVRLTFARAGAPPPSPSAVEKEKMTDSQKQMQAEEDNTAAVASRASAGGLSCLPHDYIYSNIPCRPTGAAAPAVETGGGAAALGRAGTRRGAAPPPGAGGGPGLGEGDLLRANLRKSTVIQLRARLKTLGLPTAGKKDALVERLAGDAE